MQTLKDIAWIRSGDKGDAVTIGVIAQEPRFYDQLLQAVTPSAIAELYGDWVQGEVRVFRMDNIHALLVVLHGGLGGGATSTLRLDQTGKSLGYAVLRLPLVPTQTRKSH